MRMSRAARPMATFAAEGEPGPMAQIPLFRPSAVATGPLEGQRCFAGGHVDAAAEGGTELVAVGRHQLGLADDLEDQAIRRDFHADDC